MTDKPLHVRVAEALNPQWKRLDALHWMRSDGEPVYVTELGRVVSAPRYDTDWAATGPLIERFGMQVGQLPGGHWQALSPWYAAHGDTPLLAICNLILALSEAGELNTVRAASRREDTIIVIGETPPGPVIQLKD